MSKIVKQGQSLLDKCIQSTGSIENALAFAILNGKSITDPLAIGESVEPSEVTNKTTVNYYSQIAEPATDATLEQVEELESIGIGSMAIGSTFKIG